MSTTKTVIATPAGVLIPWGHKLVDVIDGENDAMPRCAKCGLLATFNALGYGDTGDVCRDCDNEANEVIARLRSHRAA